MMLVKGRVCVLWNLSDEVEPVLLVEIYDRNFMCSHNEYIILIIVLNKTKQEVGV